MPAIKERQRQDESVMTTTRKKRTTELCRAGLTQYDIQLAEMLSVSSGLTLVEVIRRGLILQRQLRSGVIQIQYQQEDYQP